MREQNVWSNPILSTSRPAQHSRLTIGYNQWRRRAHLSGAGTNSIPSRIEALTAPSRPPACELSTRSSRPQYRPRPPSEIERRGAETLRTSPARLLPMPERPSASVSRRMSLSAHATNSPSPSSPASVPLAQESWRESKLPKMKPFVFDIGMPAGGVGEVVRAAREYGLRESNVRALGGVSIYSTARSFNLRRLKTPDDV